MEEGYCMTLETALGFIHSTDWKGGRPGLECITELMNRLGNPHNHLRYIHVVGTNGKGSVCAMLSEILTDANYKTGLFTSPHIHRVNERMKINGTDISDNALLSLVEKLQPQVAQMVEKPTEFEIITALAFLYFQKQNCDIVILEAGLGGRLDATNVIPTPEVAVVTNIGLEHTHELGSTLAAIAKEKAGIIKPGGTVVTYPLPAEVEAVIQSVCTEKTATLSVPAIDSLVITKEDLGGQFFDWKNYRQLHISLLGHHQIYNAMVAIETIEQLNQKGWHIEEPSIQNGLSSVRWPARLEVLSKHPLFLLDGAHNPQCVEMLSAYLANTFQTEKVVFLTGVLQDKEYEQMMDSVAPYAKSFVCLTPDSARALPAESLAAFLSDKGVDAIAESSIEKGIRTAMEKADGGPVVAFGSLYLASAIRSGFRSAYKKWQRNAIRTARENVPVETQKQLSHEIALRVIESPVFQKANCIMSYMAMNGEVNLTELHTIAKAQGKTVVYPYCVTRTEMVALLPNSDDAWKPGAFGILEPIPEQSQWIAPQSIDLVICPCAAFDADCNRLGMGAGYYDRYLPQCTNASISGVAFEIQKVASILTDPWDIPIEQFFTEKTTYRAAHEKQ